jgi:hypothetical protein
MYFSATSPKYIFEVVIIVRFYLQHAVGSGIAILEIFLSVRAPTLLMALSGCVLTVNNVKGN